MQAEGSEVSAELEFLNQQNLILSMENKALKQRLDNLAQEQLIKYCKFFSYQLLFLMRFLQIQIMDFFFPLFLFFLAVEQEVLEREVGRLRSLYQQQQQQQPQQQQMSSNHRRANSRDLLDQQFATLSLKHKESSPGRELHM
ncbi:hypothetical protein BUALT_Bualt15G0086000 [Buddleja alternifolia]|uniref:Uncharacterized protein n=1 Tax=Buddleja alternifolia TaxID=168488 RepID=A0AAV6WP97_9LAMI|nr:hypothetical protein BUALT_Bualt15G0086000 [Buddleja alternifolia]